MSLSNQFPIFPSPANRARRAVVAVALVGALSAYSNLAHAADLRAAAPTTIVLVHGAMADSSSWSEVAPRLAAKGYAVLAAATALRGLKSDAELVAALVKSVPGPVVLVGHSYGGAVISQVAVGNDNVKALVFVAAFAPAAGESAFDLVDRFPGSELGAALAPPLALPGAGHDLRVQPAKFRRVFAADVPPMRASAMAFAQRPVTDLALKEAAVDAAWSRVPSWFVYGSADKSIPPQAHAFMAERAAAKRTLVLHGASHAVMVSHPAEVVQVIDAAAQAATQQENS